MNAKSMAKSDTSADGCCFFPGSWRDPYDGFAISSSFGTLVKLHRCGTTLKVSGGLSRAFAYRSVWFIKPAKAKKTVLVGVPSLALLSG